MFVVYITHVISVEQIMDSVAKLKLGKSDCSQQMLSDSNINGTPKLYVDIPLLFSCMLVHGNFCGIQIDSHALPNKLIYIQ